jgi:hypothetical protein
MKMTRSGPGPWACRKRIGKQWDHAALSKSDLRRQPYYSFRGLIDHLATGPMLTEPTRTQR